jgi:hypothetical protein
MIGFLMMISIFALKFDYETLFQKRTIPQVGLEDIKDIYTVNIYDTLYDIQENNINTNNAEEVLSLAKQIIESQWQNYNIAVETDIGGLPEFASNWLNFFLLSESLPEKNYYQKGIFAKIEEKMKSINQKISNVIDYLRQDNSFEVERNINAIFLEINSLNIYLSSLISSHQRCNS